MKFTIVENEKYDKDKVLIRFYESQDPAAGKKEHYVAEMLLPDSLADKLPEELKTPLETRQVTAEHPQGIKEFVKQSVEACNKFNVPCQVSNEALVFDSSAGYEYNAKGWFDSMLEALKYS